jgi:aspartate aminotransferase
MELRSAITEKMRRYNNMSVKPDQVCVHPGAVAGIMSTYMALVNPGDEVLVPGLSWPNAEMAIKLFHGVPVHYPLVSERHFLPDISALERLVTNRTKVLHINSPGNPTGTVFDEKLIFELSEFCRRYDLWLVSDEIYEHIIFGKPHVSPGCFAPERTVTISGFSKAYAMTGWRLGYTVAPPELAKIIIKLQEPMTSCTNSLVQAAGVAALNGPQEAVELMRCAYERRRDIAVAILNQHGLYRYTPEGAFYIMVDVSAHSLDSYNVAKELLSDEGVATAPGEAFGESGKGLVRVSLANSEENIREAMERICRFVKKA